MILREKKRRGRRVVREDLLDKKEEESKGIGLSVEQIFRMLL